MLADGPDFLCVGQQKAGTTWLYDQLQFHPAFWMPPAKELHFLSGYFPHRRTLELIQRLDAPHLGLGRWTASPVAKSFRSWDGRDIAFLKRVCSLVETEQLLSLDDYASLFAPKGALLSGDISPTYAALSEARIEPIAGRFPHLKVILLARDPVERTWSDLCKLDRDGKFDRALLNDPTKLVAYAEARFGVRSYPSRIVRRWRSFFPDKVLIVPFDNVRTRPEAALATVTDFLGVEGRSGLPACFDSKGGSRKMAMPEAIATALAAHFQEERSACAALFEEWTTPKNTGTNLTRARCGFKSPDNPPESTHGRILRDSDGKS